MELQRFIDVGLSGDRQTFHRNLLRFANVLEFRFFNATLVQDRPGQEAVFIPVENNLPAAFVEALDPALSKRDPVLRHQKHQSTPLAYDQSFYIRNGAVDLWDIQAVHGYKAGVVVTVHMPRGRHLLLGLDRESALPRNSDHVASLMATLQLLASFIQDAAIRLGMREVKADNLPILTTREREVLGWTMDGKSAWAVGQILAISEHTVNFHLRNVQTKLETSSKHQAVLRALSLGIL